MINRKTYLLTFALFYLAMPAIGYGSVESTLTGIQTRLISTVLPLAAILGLVFAGLSFVAGSPAAKGRLMLAIMGAVVGFGAPSIMEFIRSLVH